MNLGVSRRTAKQIGKRIEGDIASIRARITMERMERNKTGGGVVNLPPLDGARQRLYDFLTSTTTVHEIEGSVEAGMDEPEEEQCEVPVKRARPTSEKENLPQELPQASVMKCKRPFGERSPNVDHNANMRNLRMELLREELEKTKR
ncbi:hypothetical protein OESDEN_19303, partial [Oesophagostomum dentatum]